MSDNTTQHNQIRINAVQYRANNHGFALAMRETPTDATIHAAARALDDIITDIMPVGQRINYVIGSTTVNGHNMKVLKPTTPWGEPRILPNNNPYLV